MNNLEMKHSMKLVLLLVLILVAQLFFITPGSSVDLQPIGEAEYRVVEADIDHARRRRLAPFQLCLACKCCSTNTNSTFCATMPCCFGIDCQLPNKPFGVCAFVPKTCNCTSCAT